MVQKFLDLKLLHLFKCIEFTEVLSQNDKVRIGNINDGV